ncbi:PREDICTED: leucine-rich PPR motif-containing protein, mitochondrial-like [Priapulus caudatus]|uniref:Leucine-rich PPR motif-containing protein, mitochondrial-like n=1 Tax=Priapulus caudatus TaxID=37621 RepID=A0ABM1DYR1_PRICU|nr:PREDICTED: leucine-rich PPR motif-containing protein, mitochondrial-like [Priapulus caudatus]
MKSAELPINENVFNSLITGHSKAKDMESAAGILDIMRNAQLEPSSDTYTALLCGYAENGDIANINKYIEDAEKRATYLGDKDLLDVMFTLAINGHNEHTQALMTKMRKETGFNQDAYNAVLSLVNEGQDDVAYQLMQAMTRPTRPDGTVAPVGFFFLRQLVKNERPVEKLMGIANDMQARKLNEYALSKVTECTLQLGKLEHARACLVEMKRQGLPMRTHYFWPILAAYGQREDGDNVTATLKLMVDMECAPTSETFTDYVLPFLSAVQPLDLLTDMQAIGCQTAQVVNALVMHLLYQNKITEAADLVDKHPVRAQSMRIVRPLAAAYIRSGDLDSCLRLLSHMCEHTAENRERRLKSDHAGQFILDYVQQKKGDGLDVLVTAMAEKNLKISSATAEQVHVMLKGNVPGTVAQVMDGMVSSQVELSPEEEQFSSFITHPREMNVEDLESHLIELKAKNMNVRGVMRHLLIQHCRLKNKERALEIKKELDLEGFRYSVGMYAVLMDLAVSTKDLPLALQYKGQMDMDATDFIIDSHKIINLGGLMLENDKMSDAMQLLVEHSEKRGDAPIKEALSGNAWRLLNVQAMRGDVQGTQALLELLISRGYVQPSNMLMGCPIKAHLVNNDVAGALTTFEEYVKTYKFTPWKNELFRKFIELEDSDSLQKVMDLSSSIHGEMNVLFELAFAFLETGRVKQAKKIVETPGLRAKMDRLENLCEQALKDDKFTVIENIVTITKDLFDIDRDTMYYHLLRSYRKQGDWQKALGVWTTMQEESVTPSDRTLRYLAAQLRESGQPVPFTVADEQPPPQPRRAARPAAATVQAPPSKLLELVKLRDLQGAVDHKKGLEAEGKTLDNKEYSNLIELMLEEEKLKDALALTTEMLQQGTHPYQRVLVFLLSRMHLAGDVDGLQQLVQLMPEALQSRVLIHKHLNVAYVHSGRAEELISQIEDKVKKESPDIYFNGFLFLLKKHPEYLPRVEALANAGHGNLQATLWGHYLMTEQYESADSLAKEHPLVLAHVRVAPICKEALETNNEKMLLNVLERVKGVDRVSSAILLSYLVSLQTRNGDLTGGLQTVMERSKAAGIKPSDMRTGPLSMLKRALEANSQPVPFQVPRARSSNRRNQDSSSSSDSSDSDSDSDSKKKSQPLHS